MSCNEKYALFIYQLFLPFFCRMSYFFVEVLLINFFFFFSSRRRHTRLQGDWSSDVCSSDLAFLSQGRLCACCLGGDLRDWQITVHFTHNLTHRGGERSRLARSAQGEVHVANHFAFLPPRRKEQRLELFALTRVFGVGDDADDLDFAVISKKKGDTLAQHVG